MIGLCSTGKVIDPTQNKSTGEIKLKKHGRVRNLLINCRKKSISELLLEDAYPHPDLSTGRNDAVPFSCCIRKIQAACVHEHIFNTGTSTINTFGCGRKLKNTVQSLLAFELCLNGICVPLEVST